MRKTNSLSTALLQVSLDETTDRILERMIPVGIHGKNKSEVASWIIHECIVTLRRTVPAETRLMLVVMSKPRLLERIVGTPVCGNARLCLASDTVLQ